MGGRPITTGSSAQRMRQRRYRGRLAVAGVPEADDIDRALLHELRAFAASVASRRSSETLDAREHDENRLKAIAAGAVSRLEAYGYARRQARHRLIRRLGTPPPPPGTNVTA